MDHHSVFNAVFKGDHTGHYGGDKRVLRFSRDTTKPVVSDGISYNLGDTMTIYSRLAAKIRLRLSTLYIPSPSRKQIATEDGNQGEFLKCFASLCSHE
jgi:hypothetical protein